MAVESLAKDRTDALEETSSLITQAESMLGLIIEVSPGGSMVGDALEGVRTVLGQAQFQLLRAASNSPQGLSRKRSG